ncbi:hypothetical protein [Paraburkholderia phenazinium]|jgi:hypothetical protein|uniref:Uncharacterized protein n=1 Tax=Paraburkholderia phenazinium TaxID=60549 RepID=A0A1G8J2Z8_9BURK|nr:hypothetical protein [Paraburkholderia phenazinium]SDI25040.1 hypothetical protein SAMN05216466_119103 [Paraburkholderia phenazinium]
MQSLRKAEKSTAKSLWSFAGWVICGGVTIAVTLALMGHWPLFAAARTMPVAMHATTQVPDVLTPGGVSAAQRPTVEPAAFAHPGIDVLARLESAARSSTAAQSGPNTSETLTEALQRALSYPDFSALAARSDPEGLVEAAAWADACERGALSAQDEGLRCGDVKLHGASYADDLLKKAADAGQPAAVLALADRYPDQWLEIPLPSGEMLGDRVFTLAAHAYPAALAMLSQLCSAPEVCANGLLTRNVLALLQLGMSETGTSDAGQYLTGTESEQRAATDRAAQLRAALHWPS